MASDVIHIRDIREIRVQHIPRGKNGWNTNSTDYTNTWQAMSYAFGIFVKFVFNIYHAEYFDGTRIARITRIRGKRCHSHSGHLWNSCSTYTTRNILMKHELYECIYLSVSLTQGVAQLRVASPGLWGIAPSRRTWKQWHSRIQQSDYALRLRVTTWKGENNHFGGSKWLLLGVKAITWKAKAGKKEWG